MARVEIGIYCHGEKAVAVHVHGKWAICTACNAMVKVVRPA
jgi:hypothetical protein